ncbi:MAG TPA: hypothetical protein VK633_01110 [Verrucomicrobiae bacterium]|nr:hypothetical protein [Verrucomicrobiae bacterium]
MEIDSSSSISGSREAIEIGRKRQFLFVVLLAVALASAGSHFLVRLLKIETTTGKPWSVGSSQAPIAAFLGGSSLAGDAVNWNVVAEKTQSRIFGWGVAGSSPYEWELFQKRAPDAALSIIVVSPYDLNEGFLSDFRADVVPFSHAVRSLWNGEVSWEYAKRNLSQYFLFWVRQVFPTAGRSRGIMGELRDNLSSLVRRSAPAESDSGPTLALGSTAAIPEYKRARVSDWSEGKLISKVDSLRASSRGQHAFRGLKNGALRRMMQFANAKGKAVIIVLPVSPAYTKAFLSPETLKEFEDSLGDAARTSPGAQWIRIDKMSEFHSNDYFWDLVHMNAHGQTLATQSVLKALKEGKAL